MKQTPPKQKPKCPSTSPVRPLRGHRAGDLSLISGPFPFCYTLAMISEKFQEAYKKLNPAQREAVDTIEGPVMVVAGPGTGKTQILSIRIANILLKTQVGPENILALTFTESGVLAMRRRLAEMIGTPAYKVKISTFHGFCNEIIKDYPEYFPRIIGSIHISEVDQLKILEEIISRLPLERLKTFGDEFFYIKDISQLIERLKREGLGPEDLAGFARQKIAVFSKTPDLHHTKGKYQGQMKGVYIDLQKQLEKMSELADIYLAYQHALEEKRVYDYNDMILEVKMALEKNNELRLILQEQYQYILVDEHQDTNNAQNKVLELLADFYDEPNLFVVGDEKQAIYRFQGASLENFLYFKNKYPNAKVIWLENNYRSSQLVLDVAHSLLAGDPALGGTGKKLQSAAGHPDRPIDLYEFSNEVAEDYFVASDIKRSITEGVVPDEIAVFYRDNADNENLAIMLERLGVPFVIEANQNLLSDNDLRKLILLLRTLNDFGNEELFFQALHLDFLQIPPLEIYRLAEKVASEKKSAFDLAADPKIIVAKDMMASLAKLAHNTPLAKFFERAVRDSGYLTSLLESSDPLLSLRKLQKFFSEVKKLVEREKHAKLSNLIEYLERLEKHELSVKQNPGGLLKGRVRLMTAHKSKGLEFDHVYIVRAADGRWGNKRHPEKIKLPPELFSLTGKVDAEDKNNEERRLFYVALTRARKSLTISFGRLRDDGREQVLAQFIAELNQKLIERRDGREIETELENHPELFFASSAKNDWRPEGEFIKELFLRQGFSVTHLNNYLECPWRYFYSNLLRVPQAQTASQLYGIACHSALEDFFGRLQKEGQADRDFLLEKFSYYLNQQPLEENDYKRLLTEGQKFLGGYYDTWNGSWITNTITEYKIKGVQLTPEIKLKGNIDKVEILDDRGAVNVVDYKTSAPKTRGQIEGTTKDSEGNIKRQLVFYKLLLDLYETGKFKMQSAEVDFLRPDSQGRYKKEKFTVTDEEVSALTKEIERVSNEILNLKFWDKTCDDKDCQFCRLRKMMS